MVRVVSQKLGPLQRCIEDEEGGLAVAQGFLKLRLKWESEGNGWARDMAASIVIKFWDLLSGLVGPNRREISAVRVSPSSSLEKWVWEWVV